MLFLVLMFLKHLKNGGADADWPGQGFNLRLECILIVLLVLVLMYLILVYFGKVTRRPSKAVIVGLLLAFVFSEQVEFVAKLAMIPLLGGVHYLFGVWLV